MRNATSVGVTIALMVADFMGACAALYMYGLRNIMLQGDELGVKMGSEATRTTKTTSVSTGRISTRTSLTVSQTAGLFRTRTPPTPSVTRMFMLKKKKPQVDSTKQMKAIAWDLSKIALVFVGIRAASVFLNQEN
ncbi:hypothetical protein JG688_00008392 [Phytophthora aleatoria]|uniref:Uncharacterized protein n=2 Tax=Phytophthora TaxID=4783 RepID=A0A8J5M3J3_9STRA|nr:hypothetical protein JG688_00008392 [Phytophthora aleatoria]